MFGTYSYVYFIGKMNSTFAYCITNLLVAIPVYESVIDMKNQWCILKHTPLEKYFHWLTIIRVIKSSAC